MLPDRGRFGLIRWLVNNVAERVLQEIGIPVLTVQIKKKDMSIIESCASSSL